MEAYSMDLRRRVLAACDAGHGTTPVAKSFDVSPAWVRRLKQRRRELGTIAPLPHRTGPIPRLNESRKERLRKLVEAQPDATLAELRDRLGLKITLGHLCRSLRKMKLSLKKSRSSRMSRTARM
ncbi:MAG: transposase [Planctomycetia bacterium]|nr:transposase [Planctomycetia bacterium]MBE7506385.1 transposase [Planctomycetia bacterium]MBE7506881.1 transposase [Planctomycetia bacterium]MCC7314550.1 transposase [Planctomycetota bacterium]